MKVLFIHDYPPENGGGLSVGVNELISQIQDEFECKLITSRLEDEFTDNSNNKSAIYHRWKIILFFLLLRNMMNSQLLFINFTFSFRFLCIVAVLINFILRKKAIWMFHTNKQHLMYNKFKNIPNVGLFISKILTVVQSKNTDVVVFTTEQKLELEDIKYKRVKVMPLPVILNDSYKQSEISHDKITVCFIGELSNLKCIDEIVQLIRLKGDFDILIIGDGPDILKIYDAMQFNSRVRLVKTIKHIDAIKEIAKSHILFFPCKNDTWGRVIFEAMYCETIVVGFSCAALSCIEPKYFLRVSKSEEIINVVNNMMINMSFYHEMALAAKDFSIEFNNFHLQNWLEYFKIISNEIH